MNNELRCFLKRTAPGIPYESFSKFASEKTAAVPFVLPAIMGAGKFLASNLALKPMLYSTLGTMGLQGITQGVAGLRSRMANNWSGNRLPHISQFVKGMPQYTQVGKNF